MTRTIALLTDFGINDSYVGVMKGVMHGICPDAFFIDVNHAIQPQNVREGAFTLLNCYQFFPRGTIFLVVIDPGVGSARRPVAVEAGGYTFVAPDNGILSYVLSELSGYAAYELANSAFRLNAVSATFHGRDVFAPAAAHLACGKPITEFGTRLDKLIGLHQPELTINPPAIAGEVIYIDHFGNIITSIGHVRWVDEERLILEPRFGESDASIRLTTTNIRVQIQNETIFNVCRAYHETERGHSLVQVDSNGYLEIAINQGNAAQRLGVAVGDRVELTINENM